MAQIDEIRKRYCKEAVETEEQAKAIFELLKKPLPKKYVKEFAIPTGFAYKFSRKRKESKKALKNQNELMY